MVGGVDIPDHIFPRLVYEHVIHLSKSCIGIRGLECVNIRIFEGS